MAEGEVVVSDEEPIAGSGLEDDGNLVDAYDLLRALDAEDLDMTVPRDLSAFTQTQKILLRAELTSMVAAEDAIEAGIVAESTSGIWARLGAIVHLGGNRDFRKKDEEARIHGKRARYFRELLSQIGA